MVAWHDIALCDGSPEQGFIGFHLNVTIPDATTETPATERQEEAVRLFYQYDSGPLAECQAHALLSCREYTRLCADAIFRHYPERIRQMLAPCLAAYLTSDSEMVRFATNWSERNFERGTGSPRVRGSRFFTDLERFGSYLDGCIEMNGWTMEQLKDAGRKGSR